MDRRVLELWWSELPIQLAPMGGASASPRLSLAVAAAGGHAMFPALALPPPALAPAVDALADAERRDPGPAVRPAAADAGVHRRDRGDGLYAGQTAGAVTGIQPAAEIVAELAKGVSAATRA